MRRGHDFPLAALLIVLLALGVVGGTGYAWTQFNDRIAEDTDVESVVDPGGSDDRLPDAPGLPDASPSEPAEPAYEPPTFDTLTPTANRPRPVLLLLGDGWAAGDGASTEKASYAALLADDLGWDVRTVAESGAGYTVPGLGGSTILDMFAGAPLGSIDPDAVLVQAGYAGATDTKAVTRAIADLGEQIAADLPDTPVVAVSSFRPDGVKAKQEAKMTKAWRDLDGTLVLRPSKEGWADLPTGAAGNPLDAGHQTIATSLEQALRDSGLVPQS
ncbi:SGNH/GDSL hydrolase family protein [Nocardioides dokdonensis]|uniref:SGNH/GDSL hydrolase family protein n=1 Tax=Nocardioides dokdonensis TaxID=450734 RepID=UPI000AEBCCBF|nr:SGNH/GDSL hydrolase family protein [Nocardioides dokdonensis]